MGASPNNYFVTPPQSRQVWQSLLRFDQNFSSNDRLFVRFGRYNPNTDAVQNIPNKANNDTTSGFRDTQVVVSETHVFGSRVVNDFRAGWVQEVNYSIASGGPAPELGLKGVTLSSFPIVRTGQYIQLGSGNSNRDRDRSWVFNEAVNWQIGRHTLKFGGDFRRQMYNNFNPGKQSGAYDFGTAFSSLPGVSGTGNQIADLLLGSPSNTTITLNDYTLRLNINSAAMFVQDDFKLTPKLTLNLGMRWEFDGPYSEANNQFSSFDSTVTNRATGTPGEVIFAGRNGAPTHFMPNIFHNFLPRIGFAYSFLPKTVVRAGYGIFRLPNIGFAGFGTGFTQYGVNATFPSLDGGVTPRYLLSSGVPAYSYNVDKNGLPNVPASLTSPSSTVTAIDTRDRTPYSQEWQLSLERQFGKWFAEVDYVGNKGTKLPVYLNLNQLRPDQWGPGNLQARRPFPQYAGVGILANDGNSIYHALQAKLEYRWNSGLFLSASYTFSKTINDVDAPARANAPLPPPIQNVYDLRHERGIAGYDVPQRFVVNYVYQLPVGRGGKYLHEMPVVKDIIGGWQLAGLTEFQAGLPLLVQQANSTGGFTYIQRPNLVANPMLDRGDRTINKWFNTDAFVAVPSYTQGTSPRFPLHGPGINNTDLSIMRNFPFHDRYNVQFAAQMFNAFNHAQFNQPNGTLGNKAFGVITGAQSARVTELLLRIYF